MAAIEGWYSQPIPLHVEIAAQARAVFDESVPWSTKACCACRGRWRRAVLDESVPCSMKGLEFVVPLHALEFVALLHALESVAPLHV
jgi:hypothetical protein